MRASTEHSFVVRLFFGIYSLSQIEVARRRLRLHASNEHLPSIRVQNSPFRHVFPHIVCFEVIFPYGTNVNPAQIKAG